MPLVGLYASMRGDIKAPGLPLWLAAALIFVANYPEAFRRGSTLSLPTAVCPAHDLLALCYAAELYVAYYFLRKDAGRWATSA